MASNINIDPFVVDLFERAMGAGSETKKAPENYRAKVMETDQSGTVWVHILGGSDLTPVEYVSASVNPGDMVDVRIENGKAFLTGNTTSPSAGVQYVEKVEGKADDAALQASVATEAADMAVAEAFRASEAANQAVSDAAEAAEAASSAQSSAEAAGIAASSARTSADKANYALADMEKVVGTVNWIAEHGEYALTEDTAVDDSKIYYTRSGSGTGADPYVYSRVANPVDSAISTYYELVDVDESIQNFINAHVWLAQDGLYIGTQGTDYKTRIDADSLDILDETGAVVATFGEIAQIGRDDSTHAVVDLEGLSVFDSERSAARFGIDGSRIYGPDSVPLFNIDTDGSVKTLDVVISAPSADEGFLYENITLSKTVNVPEFEAGTSVSLRPTGNFIFFERDLLVKFASNSLSRTYDASDATISSGGVTLSFSNSSSNRIKASGITLTAGTPMSAYGAVDGIKYGTTDLVWCTIDYRFDVLYDGNSSITFTHTIGVERLPWLSISELTYDAWYMSIAGTAQIKSPSYSIGTRFGDSGDYSVTVGEGLIASSDNQTAIGKYNVGDANDTYALVIGNGTDDSHRSNAFTLDWDGNVVCNEVNGLALQSMGEIREASGTESVETATNRNVASIRLPPGTWLVNARLQYPNNSTGRRAAKLSMTSEDSGSPISADVRNAVSGAVTHVQTERVFAITDSDVDGEDDGKAPVYLVAWQNSGSTLSCSGSMQAVRLSPAIGESYDGGGGGGGGTSDYTDLTNKPSIEGVTLVDDKAFPDLGLFIDVGEQYPQSDDYALTTLEINALWNNVMA